MLKEIINKLFFTAVMLVPVLLVPAPLFSRDRTVLTLESILSEISSQPDVMQAHSSLAAARAEAEAAGYRGDITFQAAPLWKTTWLPGKDTEPYHSLSATFSASLPAGLSGDEKLRWERGVVKIRLAELDLQHTLMQTSASLYRLYSTAWAAEAEIPVLEAELEAASMIRERELARYEGGEIALTDVFKSEEELRKARSALSSGRLKAELSLSDLMAKAGLVGGGGISLTPAPSFPDLPRSGDPLLRSLDGAEASLPSVVKQEKSVDLAWRETGRSGDPLLSSIRVSWSSPEQSASASWNFGKPSLSMSYTPPGIPITEKLPSGSGGAASDQSSITAGVTFSYGTSKGAKLAENTARAVWEAEALKLETLLRTGEKEIRNRKAEYESAVTLIEPAEEAAVRAERLLEAVIARDSLGLTNPGDSAAAEASLLRARYQAGEAVQKAETAWIALLEAAGFPDGPANPISPYLSGGLK